MYFSLLFPGKEILSSLFCVVATLTVARYIEYYSSIQYDEYVSLLSNHLIAYILQQYY